MENEKKWFFETLNSKSVDFSMRIMCYVKVWKYIVAMCSLVLRRGILNPMRYTGAVCYSGSQEQLGVKECVTDCYIAALGCWREINKF